MAPGIFHRHERFKPTHPQFQYLGSARDEHGTIHDLFIYSFAGGWELSARYGEGRSDHFLAVVFLTDHVSWLKWTLERPLLKAAWELATNAGVLDFATAIPKREAFRRLLDAV